MEIIITKEDFLAAPRGFYGGQQCPLYQALKRTFPSYHETEKLVATTNSVNVGAKYYSFTGWTANEHNEKHVFNPLFNLEEFAPKYEKQSVAQVNQWWLDVRAGKEIPEIKVEIMGL